MSMTDKEEILRNCTNSYKSVPTLESTVKSSPDTEKLPDFKEVESTMKVWKNTKPMGWMELQVI